MRWYFDGELASPSFVLLCFRLPGHVLHAQGFKDDQQRLRVCNDGMTGLVSAYVQAQGTEEHTRKSEAKRRAKSSACPPPGVVLAH
ncbi:hypothetical protein DBV39_17600 [Orrella marina]|uniref:Uncharacterized protein n=1 Tax=Orrella marina TaxID=2163011 RepID=A0A2R4XNA1_9BURK|nr:hypothetical protein DBV39_17600 [Orrella marina]